MTDLLWLRDLLHDLSAVELPSQDHGAEFAVVKYAFFDRKRADSIHCLTLQAQVAEVWGWNLQTQTAHSSKIVKN